MGMSGWIKIHREITKHWIFQDAEKFKWWIDMLFLASYEDNKTVIGNKIVEVKRGQFLGSLSFFMKRWGISKERVINFLRLLQSDGMIDKMSDKNVTLITICNYESYQDVPDNKADNLSDYKVNNLPDNLPDTTKEGKEIQEIYISSTAHTCEEEFIRRYREEGDNGMWANTALILHKKIPECKELFERWIVEFQHNGEKHSDYTDFKRHFISWARIAISKESRQQSNGNNRPDHSRRGRADVPADITLDF
mgnify:CR=1 FL=1